MQFTIVSILALATAALSMPAGQEKRDDHARADLCTSSHHGGYCINFGLLPYGKSHCWNFKDDFYQFNDALSSIYPSDGATWTLYADPGCNGRSLDNIVAPGIEDLNDPLFNFNDIASSISVVYK